MRGDLLERVRAIVGAHVLIAAELDPHSHLTRRRVANADILAAFLEFPHTDFFERGGHVVDLALRTLRGEIKPVMAAFDCRMIDVFPTSREPMRSFVDRLSALQGRDGVLSLSLIHGFMAADVPGNGNADARHRRRRLAIRRWLARTLGLEVFALRGQTAMPMLGIDAGLDAALELAARKTGRPTVVADVWDNPGGGVAGDGTLILRRMLERGIGNFAVATIWDPIAVNFCLAAGEGARLQLRFGGKAGPDGGAPIDADGRGPQGDRRILAELWREPGHARRFGACPLAGTDIEMILNTNRTQTFEPDSSPILASIRPAKDILLVESTNHFYAGFAPIAAGIVYIDAGAPYPSHPRETPYRKLAREIWPRIQIRTAAEGSSTSIAHSLFGVSPLRPGARFNHIAAGAARRPESGDAHFTYEVFPCPTMTALPTPAAALASPGPGPARSTRVCAPIRSASTTT